MSQGLVTASYIVAAVLFILSLAGLSKQETAKYGNWFGIVGMAIALIATLVAIEINKLYGMTGVGIYVFINGILSLIALVSMKETKDVDLMD